MAEGVGFEPTEAFVSQVFRTSALNRSAIPPYGSHGWSRTNLPRVRTWYSTDKLHGYVEAAEGIEPPSPGSKPDAQTAVLCRYVVGQVGLEPTMFLMSRFYRPLPSPIWILTHMVAGAGLEPASMAYEAIKEPLLQPAIWCDRRDLNPHSFPEPSKRMTRFPTHFSKLELHQFSAVCLSVLLEPFACDRHPFYRALSNLSYSRISGGASRTRTCNPLRDTRFRNGPTANYHIAPYENTVFGPFQNRSQIGNC